MDLMIKSGFKARPTCLDLSLRQSMLKTYAQSKVFTSIAKRLWVTVIEHRADKRR